jgi:ribose 5-phosphate isomerase RpiB
MNWQYFVDHLRRQGHEVIDAGTHSTEPADYPDFAEGAQQVIWLSRPTGES